MKIRLAPWLLFLNYDMVSVQSYVLRRNKLKSPLYVGDTQGDYEACLTAQVPFVWAAYGFGTPTGYYAKIEDFARLLSLV